ncbi:MAG TPA: tetratricopeptide repeat protein [Casimicrobiaceae bacterium]
MIPTTDSTEAERLCEEGYGLLEAGRFEEAYVKLARACSLAPDNPLIHYRLGLLFSDTGRPLEALAALDTALSLQPDNPRAHNNRGSALQMLGREADAEKAYQRAIELAPDLELPHLNLGRLLEQQGKMHDAAEVYKRAIARGLDAEMFGHYLAAVSGRITRRAPDRLIRDTFDNFAPTFDTLLRTLGYDAPRQLAAMLQSRTTAMLDILDLGCGTGQCGVAVAKQKRHLVGVDLSEKMLVRARAHGVYDELHVGEVHAWLREAATGRFDAVTAADVLIYIGALEELFREVARVLRDGGWFVFSTEESEAADYTLLPTARYAHSKAYISRLAETAFAIIEANAVVIRTEFGAPVEGRLYLLQKL